MGFFDWYLSCVKNHYADFNGRARRTEYWLFKLVNVIINVVLLVIGGLIHFAALGSIYYLVVLIPGLAVAVRRLHDTGRSGWWTLFASVPLIGTIVLIVFFATEGTRGSNGYGPDPKLS